MMSMYCRSPFAIATGRVESISLIRFATSISAITTARAWGSE